VKVFNLQGEEVATLLVGRLAPGHYSMPWQPQGLASGVYFYRLSFRVQGESMGLTKKLLFLK